MISIRVNTLKSNIELISKMFADKNIVTQQVAWQPDALLVSTDMDTLTGLDAHTNGLFVVQNLSSLLAVRVLNPLADEEVLDMCAAPGMKTAYIAACMNNTGQLVANDVSKPRLFKLNTILSKLGVSNASTSLLHGEKLWRKYPLHFDKVLVDVPCSMGQVYKKRNLAMLVKRQKYLAWSAVSATKPGGIVVYSTCTSTKKENENVIAWLLKKAPNVAIEQIALPNLPDEYFTTEGFLRIPEDPPLGRFFVARLRVA